MPFSIQVQNCWVKAMNWLFFSEGSHRINCRVRPLRKGFTRVVLETFERYPKMHLQLVPVGLNYWQSEKFGDRASLNFGNPIDLTTDANTNTNERIVNLKEQVFHQI